MTTHIPTHTTHTHPRTHNTVLAPRLCSSPSLISSSVFSSASTAHPTGHPLIWVCKKGQATPSQNESSFHFISSPLPLNISHTISAIVRDIDSYGCLWFRALQATGLAMEHPPTPPCTVLHQIACGHDTALYPRHLPSHHFGAMLWSFWSICSLSRSPRLISVTSWSSDWDDRLGSFRPYVRRYSCS